MPWPSLFSSHRLSTCLPLIIRSFHLTIWSKNWQVSEAFALWNITLKWYMARLHLVVLHKPNLKDSSSSPCKLVCTWSRIWLLIFLLESVRFMTRGYIEDSESQLFFINTALPPQLSSLYFTLIMHLFFPFFPLAITQIVSSIYLDMRASYQSWVLCFMWMMSPKHCRFTDGRETLHFENM